MSKRTIAREWLIFIAMLPVGFLTCLWLGYHANFDRFWNFSFGFKGTSWYKHDNSPYVWLLWLLPYALLMLARSVIWALKEYAGPK